LVDPEPQSRARRWIRSCLLWGAVLISVYCCVVGLLIVSSFESDPPLSAKARRITKGMTQDDVVRIIGQPRGVFNSNDPSQSEIWYYDGGATISMEGGRVVQVHTFNP
jgi:hypothetical protein